MIVGRNPHGQHGVAGRPPPRIARAGKEAAFRRRSAGVSCLSAILTRLMYDEEGTAPCSLDRSLAGRRAS